MEILIKRQKTDTKLDDDIIHLPDHYLTTSEVNPMNPNLSSRKKFMYNV